jgi:iron(III) transport system permease protein
MRTPQNLPLPAWLEPSARALRIWRARRRASPVWTLLVAAILALVLFPIAAILWLALGSSGDLWAHLAGTTLPAAVSRTLVLLLGVGALTLVIGTLTAWLVTVFQFPGRDAVAWLLIVPLAMPTYIIAYCYADLLDYAGPLQGMVRDMLGVHSRRDYLFPEIRSLGGLVLVLSAVLYPYVYLSARASFLQQSVGTLEVARTLGRSLTATFFTVALPLARPALAAGVALALLESLHDIGASEHLGVRTLTVTAYATWLQRSSLAGAAQIASVMLLFVVALLVIEYMTRGRGGFSDPAGRQRPVPETELTGGKAAAALLVCLLPFVVGFAVPAAVLVGSSLRNLAEGLDSGFWKAAAVSVLVAGLVGVLTLVLSLGLAYARRVAANGFTRPAVRLASIGYAVPGTVLAIGVLIPLAALDNRLDALMRGSFGVSTGLLLSGSAFAVVLALTIRFMAVAFGVTDAGLSRISSSLDAAARTLGESAFRALRRVHLPLLRPAMGAALLIVFVDAMKELPATLLLRPFDFETLAIRVYEHASLERFEEAGLAALAIVLVGLVPLIVLNRTLSGDASRT